MTEPSTELLPCPFCGGTVTMSDMHDEDDRRMWVRDVECETCQVKMTDWSGWQIPFNREYLSNKVGINLAKMWNRRNKVK